jgi:tetrahydromethanopterin S-methyltransferase subunit E
LHRAFGVAAVRLALGAAGVAIALARGLDPLPAFAAAVLGGLVFAVIALGQSSRAGLRHRAEAQLVPSDALFDPAWMTALQACIPSTLGVGVLTIAALVFSPPLAAVLAGVLISMGLLALVSGVEVVALERREHVRYWLERGSLLRRFVESR